MRVDDQVLKGFPTPSGKLEFYSSTVAAWGWPELAVPTYIKSHVHPEHMDPDQKVLISTFRIPTQIHTRSANAKWLDEISHTNPLWLHPDDARPLGVTTGDLMRVTTEIGHFVVKAWVTQGIKPGVVACSHHMGRWKLHDEGQRQLMATATLDQDGSRWSLKRKTDVGPLHLLRPGHRAHLVDRRGSAPEPHFSSAPRPDLRHALLASGGADFEGGTRGPLR